MADHFRQIYRHQAERYDRLVAREDYQGNLFAALNDIRPLNGLQVVEFGAGTGRLTRLLSVMVDQVYAFDIEHSMLSRARESMTTTGMCNWSLARGDNHRMPVRSGVADLVIEGWSFGHATEWYSRNWRHHIDRMLAEMQRIARRGGTAILIETMGTGARQPIPPADALAQLYDYWQTQHGFNYRWIRTDFHFASSNEAAELMRFFFGDELARRALQGGKVIVPECTGIWWKHLD